MKKRDVGMAKHFSKKWYYDNYYYNQYSNTIEIKRVWLTVPFSEVVTRERDRSAVRCPEHRGCPALGSC